MSKTKKKGKFVLIGVAVVLVAGFVGLNMLSSQLSVPILQVTKAELKPIKSFVSSTGTVANGEQVEYIASGNTMVSDVPFKVGDLVKQGDVLVKFEHSDALNDYRSAEINYEKQRLAIEDSQRLYFENMEDIEEAKEEMAYAKTRRADFEDYSNQDAEAKFQYEKYDASYNTYKNKVEALEKAIPSDATLKREQLSLEEATLALTKAKENKDKLPQNIVAQSDGVIESLGVRKLTPAAKGTVCAIVRYNTTDIINFKIGKYDLDKVKLGQPVDIKVGRSKYTGTVTQIGFDATGGTVPAKITVSNPDTSFVGGFEAELDILTYSVENILSLPSEAVKTDRQGDYCYTITPGEKEETFVPTKVYITTGESSDTDIVILEGISEGDRVITNPSMNIDTLTIIKIKE